MPDCSVRNVLVSRAIVGSDSSARPLTVLPTVAFRVCNSTPDACTSTVCDSLPTFMVTLFVDTMPTSITSLGIVTLENPALVTVMS